MKRQDRLQGDASLSGAPVVLSRDMLEGDRLAALILRDAPAQRLTSEAERAASLRAVLEGRPKGDIWVFAYGSLLWNPTIEIAEKRKARICGWHRSFCLSTVVGRGSPDKPGLLLGLDADGACEGVAFRLARDVAEAELALLWRREMITGAYHPRWVELHDEGGGPFGNGIAFTINAESDQYAGTLHHDEIIERLAFGMGVLGSAADYLFRTRQALRVHGIVDASLEHLALEVEVCQAASVDR